MAAFAAFAVAPHGAHAASCTLPKKQPLWIDFADGSVPFWPLFAQPGVVAAASNFIVPPQLRAAGATTIYWDMNLPRRVGTPTEPFETALVIDRANRLYDYAAASMGCSTPTIAENELFGAGTITPWSASNAIYRANVLLYLRILRQRGARPVLLVSSTPYTGGDAADWWRQVSQVADLVREDYFPAPKIFAPGPILASRSLREAFRRSASDFLSIGIPPSKLGIMLGFQTTPGLGGREQLEPARSWFEVVKLQTLAARVVAKEMHLRTVWSWGWGVWSKAEDDPDKRAAACIWLWARDPNLCDGISAGGAGFDSSLTEGQPAFPRTIRCTVRGQPVAWGTAAGISRVVGDSQAAFTAAYGRAVAALYAPLKANQILAAEQAIIAMRFGGSRAAYVAALRRAHASVSVARGVIADELRRARVQANLRVPQPTEAAIEAYYATYASTQARFVKVAPAPTWLANQERGFALASVAPPQVFDLPAGRKRTVRTMLGTYKVRAYGSALPLAQLPLSTARPAISAALVALAREEAYQSWLLARENALMNQTICWRDQLPAIDVVPLTDYLPFLALDEGAASSSGVTTTG